MDGHFDDYPGFQPKITPPKHFSRQCTLMHFKVLRLKCTQWCKGLSENESHVHPRYFSICLKKENI